MPHRSPRRAHETFAATPAPHRPRQMCRAARGTPRPRAGARRKPQPSDTCPRPAPTAPPVHPRPPALYARDRPCESRTGRPGTVASHRPAQCPPAAPCMPRGRARQSRSARIEAIPRARRNGRRRGCRQSVWAWLEDSQKIAWTLTSEPYIDSLGWSIARWWEAML